MLGNCDEGMFIATVIYHNEPMSLQVGTVRLLGSNESAQGVKEDLGVFSQDNDRYDTVCSSFLLDKKLLCGLICVVVHPLNCASEARYSVDFTLASEDH